MKDLALCAMFSFSYVSFILLLTHPLLSNRISDFQSLQW